jgi:outer membrane lipoprotein-sorting protein
MTALLIAVSSAAASGSPAGPMLARLYSSEALSAVFVQTDFWVLTRETGVTGGTLSLSADGRFLLDYDEPDGRTIGFDGSVTFTVDPSSRQVLLDESGEPAGFAALLESAGRTDILAGSSVSGDTVTVVLEGDIGQGIDRMEFSFLSSDSLPRSLETSDANGNATSWVLTAPSTEPLDPSVFEVEIPAGFEVLRSGEL